MMNDLLKKHNYVITEEYKKSIVKILDDIIANKYITLKISHIVKSLIKSLQHEIIEYLDQKYYRYIISACREQMFNYIKYVIWTKHTDYYELKRSFDDKIKLINLLL